MLVKWGSGVQEVRRSPREDKQAEMLGMWEGFCVLNFFVVYGVSVML